eukprot:scaffold12998_cov113-Isochrysis_galbana.AAC.3
MNAASAANAATRRWTRVWSEYWRRRALSSVSWPVSIRHGLGKARAAKEAVQGDGGLNLKPTGWRADTIGASASPTATP